MPDELGNPAGHINRDESIILHKVVENLLRALFIQRSSSLQCNADDAKLPTWDTTEELCFLNLGNMFVKGQTEKQNKTDQAMVTASIASCFKVILDVSKKNYSGFLWISI